MIQLDQPYFLALLPVSVAVYWYTMRRPPPTLGYSDHRLFIGLPRGRAAWVPRGIAIARALVLAALILALAGPYTDDRTSGYRLPTEGIALSLVLDTSGSMAANDFEWQPGEPATSRLEAARRVLRRFLQGGTTPNGLTFAGRPSDLVGLVTFAQWPYPICPLTLSHEVLLRLLDEQRPADELHTGSNVGDAIAQGVLELDAAPARRKVMILLSDGEHNFDLQEPRKPLKPRQAAQLAAQRGITIYAIDTGGEPTPAAANNSAMKDAYQQRIDGRETLQQIVDLTGGKLFTANNSRELFAVCEAIDGLERDTILTFRYRRRQSWDHWLAGLALVLALGVAVMERGPWKSLP